MKKSDRQKNMMRTAFIAVCSAFLLATLVPALGRRTMRAPRLRAVPTIPTANRTAGNRVILEKADNLSKAETDSFMVVTGSVEFSKGPMLMFCDSAHYMPETGSLSAFGDVRMRQGDTLFVYADELQYDGVEEIAHLYGYEPTRPVRMINRDVKLETDVFTYDMRTEIGFYNTYGVLTDNKNKLISTEGEYMPSTKDANFYTDVVLTSLSGKDTLTINTDTLFYNTATHVAEFNSPTTIYNADGEINTTEGFYNTESGGAELFARSKVHMRRGTTLEGDTLFYNRKTGIGEAFGNMAIVDSARQSSLHGDYGYYDEIIDSAYVTGRALAKEYSRGDTLYMHGRYITSVLTVDSVSKPLSDSTSVTVADSTHILKTWPRVRFFRSDMQGICDSMTFVERDSMLYMHVHPVVWSDKRQIFGNLIMVHLNDSTVDRADFPDFAFSAEEIEDPYYNQLSGKKMTAYFEGGKMRKLDVSGNVQVIMYPEENDSTINKLVTLDTSFLTVLIKDNAIERMKSWPESSGKVVPLYQARKSMLKLPKFEWFAPLRPDSPDEVFVVPPEMDELMGRPVENTQSKLATQDNASRLPTQ